MSYINDALNKVQKEKESSCAPYESSVALEDKKPDKRRKWFSVIGLAIVFFYAAGMLVWLYWPDVRKAGSAVTPVQSPGIATVPSIKGLPAAEVPETATPQPLTPADVAAPMPAIVEKKSAADKTLAVEKKEKKQNVVIPAGEVKQDASPMPARKDTTALYAQALRRQSKGELEEAKVLYRKVIKADPRHVSALNNLGVIFMNQKMYEKAVASFNEALHIRHNYVDAHYNLACLYAQKNDTKQSLFYLKNAMVLNPVVRQWAARDDDLRNLADLPEFNKIMQMRKK